MLAAVALAFAFFALLRSGLLAGRVRELQAERDELLALVATQRKQLEGERRPNPVEIAHARGGPLAAEGPPLRAPDPADDGTRAPLELHPSPRPATSSTPLPVNSDWESNLGVEGAGWTGGIALILSAAFFMRSAIDEGLIGAGTGLLVMLAAGALALASAELGFRRGLRKSTSPLSAAGVAILYVAIFAAPSRYAPISPGMAFAGLTAISVAAGLLAARYRASAPAFLGIVGGFGAAWALLNRGESPAVVFAYVLLLNAGVLAVVVKGRWFALLWPSLLATLLLQVRWFWTFCSPETLPAAIGVALAPGLFYLALPMAAEETDNRRLLRPSAVGSLVPFLFAFTLATSAKYVDQWPLLFSMIAAMDGAILITTVLFGRVGLLGVASITTSLTLAWWALQGLKVEGDASLFGSILFAIAIVSIFGVARRAAVRFGRVEGAGLRILDGAALVAGGGLFFFGLVVVGYDRGAPAGPFLTLATALGVLLIEISNRQGRLAGVLGLCSASLVVLTQAWFFSAVNATNLVLYLAGPIVVSLLLVVLARRKARRALDLEAEIAVQFSAWVSIAGLFLALAQSDRTSSGWPLFLALASTGWPILLALVIQAFVIIDSVMRTDWTIELPVLAAACALHLELWQRGYLTPDQQGVALGFGALLFATFLGLPLLVSFGRWQTTWPPWLASAIAGPLFFFPLTTLYKAAFGASTLGVLPVILAGLAGLTLREICRRSGASGQGGQEASHVIPHVPLFLGVIFLLLALAVRVQFDRQWVTLGWALEALGLCWLFARLRHAGLAAFAGILYALMAARLFLNPSPLGDSGHGLPILNDILYTYGIAMACCWGGQSLLRRASDRRGISYLAGVLSLIGVLLGFLLVNLEILDFFSSGSRIAPDDVDGHGAKLAFSVGWGVYAVGLFVAGVVSHRKPLRYLSLAFLILTVGKVFFYDLAALGGIFRALSFLGLAAGLLVVSLFYRRFVFKESP